MNLQKSKILLDKINALHKSMLMDEGNIAAIERDLMLSYVRQLYETMLEDGATKAAPPVRPATKSVEQPRFEIIEVPIEEVEPEPEEKPVYRAPRIIELPDSLKDFTEPTPQPKPKPTYQAPPPPQPKPQQTYRPPEPKPEPRPVIPKPEPKPEPKVEQTTIKPEHELLFERPGTKDLSEKLGEQPIRDLTKAIALNDKLLYANELFGKELVAFNEAIHRLNNMHSFEEAKTYMSKLAEQYDWTAEHRLEMAKDLSKLVRRRFI